MRTVPESGRRNPRSTDRSVVFPAPLGPMRPTVSPRRTSRLTPSRARVRRPRRPYVFETFATEITGQIIRVSRFGFRVSRRRRDTVDFREYGLSFRDFLTRPGPPG